jgi:hypothetical protein
MDEPTFRAARGEINRLPCVFEKALLAGCAACELASRHSIGERETVSCAQPLARATCGTLHGLLREKSAFALGIAEARRILPHSMGMKVQCGGLEGMRGALDPEAPGPDVQRLLRLGLARYGSLDELPFSEIIKGVAAWQVRRRNRK